MGKVQTSHRYMRVKLLNRRFQLDLFHRGRLGEWSLLSVTCSLIHPFNTFSESKPFYAFHSPHTEAFKRKNDTEGKKREMFNGSNLRVYVWLRPSFLSFIQGLSSPIFIFQTSYVYLAFTLDLSSLSPAGIILGFATIRIDHYACSLSICSLSLEYKLQR